MKKQTGLTIIAIAGFIWLLHTIYLHIINPELNFIQAFIAGPRIPDILFRLILLVLVLVLALRRVQGGTSAKVEEYIKLKKAVDTSGEVIFITDRDGIFTYVNPEFTNVYGFTPEEIIGKKTPRILKSNVMSPENYRKFWQHILQKQVVKGEIVNKTKSGELIDVESSANPILNAKDDIIGFLSIQRDITERKIKEKVLEESEKTARAMLNASDDPVVLIDRNGEFLSANEAAMLMLDSTPDELVGKSIQDFEIFHAKHRDSIKQAIQSEGKVCFEEKIQDQIGRAHV